MRFARRRARKEDERILPLINVVFLLLIFFMLTGRLAATDPIEVAPPRSAGEGMPDVEEILVLVGADGRLALDSQVMDAATLERAVAERVAASEALRVRLKADGAAEAVNVVAVMELLRDAGVERLSLLTVPEGR